MKLSRRLLAIALGAGLAAVASPARAAPIVVNQWYTFRFAGPGTLGADCGPCTLGVRSIPPGDPAWTINTATRTRLYLSDGFQQGDSFTLFDNAGLVGSTPGVATDPNHTCGNDELGCFADPLMSHAAFAIGAGAHAFEIRVDASPYGAGAAFFCLEEGAGGCVRSAAVPEPSTYALLATGILGIAGLARRRRLG